MYVPFIAFKPLWVSRHEIGGGWQCSGRVLARHASASSHPHAHLHTNPHKHIYTLSLKFSLSMSDLWHTMTHTHNTDGQRITGRYMIMPWRWSFWKRLFWAAFTIATSGLCGCLYVCIDMNECTFKRMTWHVRDMQIHYDIYDVPCTFIHIHDLI